MNLNLRIDRNKSIPLRHQLRVQLDEMISTRKLTGCLPPEEEISKSLNISRGTVRAALDDLYSIGLLRRIPGKGTYVNENNSYKGNIIIYMNHEPSDFGIGTPEDNYNSVIIKNLFASSHRAGLSVIFRKMPDSLSHTDLYPFFKTGVLLLNPRKDFAGVLKTMETFSNPSVVLGANTSDYGLDFVAADNNLGVKKGLNYLTDMGHRRIGYVGSKPGSFDSTERFECFKRLARKKNIYEAGLHAMIESPKLESPELKSGILEVFAKWRRAGLPTAIITGGLQISIFVMEIAKETGLRIPEDISLIGYDDFEISGYLDPPLTSVRQPIPGMVDSAVSLLRKKIEASSDAFIDVKNENTKIILTPELIVRKSCRAV